MKDLDTSSEIVDKHKVAEAIQFELARKRNSYRKPGFDDELKM